MSFVKERSNGTVCSTAMAKVLVKRSVLKEYAKLLLANAPYFNSRLPIPCDYIILAPYFCFLNVLAHFFLCLREVAFR